MKEVARTAYCISFLKDATSRLLLATTYLLLIMNLEILTPEKKIFSGDVYGIQLPGIDGMFEILDRHAPLVSALKAGKMKILKDKNSFSHYTIQGGFVEVLKNNISVLVEGASEA